MRPSAKRLSRILVLLLVVFALGSCASPQQTPSETYGPLPAPTPTPPPPDPTAGIPPTNPAETPGPTPAPVPESPRVTLVLGGAGVASFATVGILKRFEEEGIRVNLIVTTGWPTLFALGYGFMKSVHDLEWFAMRLSEKDFYSVGVFDTNKDFEDHDELSRLIKGAFQQRDLSDARIPVIVSAANTELGEPQVFDRGDWKGALLKTMSVPGIYRPYPEKEDEGWINSLQGIDVDEAVRRGAGVIVAVQMYDDYFDSVKKSRKPSSDSLFRKLYLARLKSDLGKQMKQAHVVGKIDLGKAPGDFSQKRLAILAGYREGARIAKQLRPLLKR